MIHPICSTCGVQYGAASAGTQICMICEDERQYVGLEGQKWTTLEVLRSGHENVILEEESRLSSFVTTPKFGIGQRALLIKSPGGNILWDCISLIDEKTISAVEKLGGIAAVAISHPHYYSSMIEWSRAFGGVPVYVHDSDRRWVARPDPAVSYWTGESLPLHDSITLIRCGGHFDGATVLHWPAGAEGRGVILAGDVLQVCPDRRHVSFMYSYPNYIPLPAHAVRRALAAVEPFAFDRIYGFTTGLQIDRDAKEAVNRSADRYLKAIGAILDECPPPL